MRKWTEATSGRIRTQWRGRLNKLLETEGMWAEARARGVGWVLALCVYVDGTDRTIQWRCPVDSSNMEAKSPGQRSRKGAHTRQPSESRWWLKPWEGEVHGICWEHDWEGEEYGGGYLINGVECIKDYTPRKEEKWQQTGRPFWRKTVQRIITL